MAMPLRLIAFSDYPIQNQNGGERRDKEKQQ